LHSASNVDVNLTRGEKDFVIVGEISRFIHASDTATAADVDDRRVISSRIFNILL